MGCSELDFAARHAGPRRHRQARVAALLMRRNPGPRGIRHSIAMNDSVDALTEKAAPSAIVCSSSPIPELEPWQ
jgi:hypothetical protein